MNMAKSSKLDDQIMLSAGEQKFVQQIRRWQHESDGRPMMASVVIQDGVWHIYQGKPKGAVKDT